MNFHNLSTLMMTTLRHLAWKRDQIHEHFHHQFIPFLSRVTIISWKESAAWCWKSFLYCQSQLHFTCFYLRSHLIHRRCQSFWYSDFHLHNCYYYFDCYILLYSTFVAVLWKLNFYTKIIKNCQRCRFAVSAKIVDLIVLIGDIYAVLNIFKITIYISFYLEECFFSNLDA